MVLCSRGRAQNYLLFDMNFQLPVPCGSTLASAVQVRNAPLPFCPRKESQLIPSCRLSATHHKTQHQEVEGDNKLSKLPPTDTNPAALENFVCNSRTVPSALTCPCWHVTLWLIQKIVGLSNSPTEESQHLLENSSLQWNLPAFQWRKTNLLISSYK